MCHRVEITMPCEPASVPAARHWAVEHLGQMYAAPGGAADDAQLVVSELVSNCVRADAQCFALVLDGHHHAVHIEATDDAPGLPAARPASPTDPHGRGLFIVDRLADDWGVTPEGPGKTVWADLTVGSDCSPTFDCSRTA